MQMDILNYQILLMGDTASGKTCFLNRYLYNTFEPEKVVRTGGFFCYEKSVKLKNGKKLRLLIRDICAYLSFERKLSSYKDYYKTTNGIIFLYDITYLGSFQELKKFVYSEIEEIRKSADKNLVIFLVGNKKDLYYEQAVPEEEGENFAKEQGFYFSEASAKNDYNVKDIFQDLAETIYNPNYPKLKEKENEKKKQEYIRKKREKMERKEKEDEILHYKFRKLLKYIDY